MKEQFNSRHRKIQSILRSRIFLSGPDDQMVFRETELAKEFGLSRTPIRQILQSLAHESLVQTQSGIGTTPVPLEPQFRERDFKVYSQIALAASEVPGNNISNDIKLRILGLAQLADAEATGNQSLEVFGSLAQESGDATCEIIGDPVLSEALAAARWRVIRWRMRDYHLGADAFWKISAQNFKRTSQAILKSDPRHYLRTVAGVVDDMVTTENP